MSAITRAFGADIINHVFLASGSIKHDNLYAALYTQSPTKSGGGTEVSGGGYERVRIQCSTTEWEASDDDALATSNRNVIEFPVPSSDWGTVTHFGLHTQSSGTDNLAFFGELVQPVMITGGDGAPKFQAGAIDIRLEDPHA